MQISLGFLRDIEKKTHAAKLYCLVMNAGFAELLCAHECTVGAGQGLEKTQGLSPASSATLSVTCPEDDILSFSSVPSSEDVGRERDKAKSMLLVLLHITGYSKVGASRINVAGAPSKDQ